MFIIHTVSTRIANSLKETQKALTSGMYLSFYYIGGAVGSVIPPFLYQSFGWDITILFCAFLLFFVLIYIFKNRVYFKDYN